MTRQRYRPRRMRSETLFPFIIFQQLRGYFQRNGPIITVLWYRKRTPTFPTYAVLFWRRFHEYSAAALPFGSIRSMYAM